ncbi:hypothetical protein [Haloplanus salinarum]|uniref:hypothetical protein n=1 Tax=Haloplanus salinarum TaxID=1912324 RepID=UPI00214B50F5|nr:hypothetical protein [Haloplanus salinarum]
MSDFAPSVPDQTAENPPIYDEYVSPTLFNSFGFTSNATDGDTSTGDTLTHTDGGEFRVETGWADGARVYISSITSAGPIEADGVRPELDNVLLDGATPSSTGWLELAWSEHVQEVNISLQESGAELTVGEVELHRESNVPHFHNIKQR